MKETSSGTHPLKAEKEVFSTSLTKTSEFLASNPIVINSSKKSSSSKQPRDVAQSCPNFTYVPPPPPRTKPNVPSRDPPPMLLPPSPPVFSPMQILVAHSQLSEVQNVLSRSLTHFSSSCPNPSYLQSFGVNMGMSNFPIPMDNNFPPSIHESSFKEEDLEERMSELGKSPTIFSLLQGSSVPSSRAQSMYNSSSVNLGSGNRSNSVFNRSSAFDDTPQNEDGNRSDVPEDDLLFSISLDQHGDDSFLAQSTQDFLNL